MDFILFLLLFISIIYIHIFFYLFYFLLLTWGGRVPYSGSPILVVGLGVFAHFVCALWCWILTVGGWGVGGVGGVPQGGVGAL